MSVETDCMVCGAARPDDKEAGLCLECRREAGILRVGPPLRPPSPCARCGHRQIVRVQMRERTSEIGGDMNRERVRPIALTWPLGEKFKGFFLDKVRAAAPDLNRGYGLLEAYVCRSCGVTEIFARDPDAIPIGPEFGTELIEVPGDGTYR